MYTPMPKEVVENIRKHGTLTMGPAGRWYGSTSEVFVPHEAAYVSFGRGDRKSTKVARFYVTSDKDKMKYERLTIHHDVASRDKSVEMMFLRLLFNTLISHAQSRRARIIQVESKHSDIAEIFLDLGFDFRNKEGSFIGKSNVQNCAEKAKETD